MEKKTLGSFLAALRKSSGMTQKQLADKLNVSDKAISRWERDESAPDLTLIPVIAEIFGITSDELLRGERSNPASNPSQVAARSEKQLQRILKDTQTKFRIRGSISLGISLLGLIAAMICNFAFLRARLGFLVGCLFYVAAAICQSIFLIQAQAAIDDDSFDSTDLNGCKREFFRVSSLVFSSQLVILLLSVPLLFVDDAYRGITFASWLPYAALFGILGACICFAVFNRLHLSLSRKGRLNVEEAEVIRTKQKLKLLRSFLLILAILLLFQAFLNEIQLGHRLIPGTSFYSWEEFKAYMETPVPYQSSGTMAEEPVAPVPDGDITYFDDAGNEISEDEFYTDEVLGPDGQILCTYVRRNHNVFRIRYSGTRDMLPVTVHTAADLARGEMLMQIINICYLLLYAAALEWVILRYKRIKG